MKQAEGDTLTVRIGTDTLTASSARLSDTLHRLLTKTGIFPGEIQITHDHCRNRKRSPCKD